MLFHRLPSSEFFRRDSELTACHCEPGAEFGWRPQLATFASDHVHAKGAEGEKRRQRDFIKKHTGIKVREGGRDTQHTLSLRWHHGMLFKILI